MRRKIRKVEAERRTNYEKAKNYENDYEERKNPKKEQKISNRKIIGIIVIENSYEHEDRQARAT